MGLTTEQRNAANLKALETTDGELKPWPTDAVVIVCARPDEFLPEQIRGRPIDGRCADCGQTIKADSWTIDRAVALPQRCERPLRFMCIECFALYDFGQVTYSEDHRGGKTVIRKGQKHG